ncbi:MAG: fumarylacetoacetate hydrolase family protein, partial [Bdellovibrionales bacterium]|nr:fumarylacetoacetate hydrolase family protein [Bdellovibrionales bacterium]
ISPWIVTLEALLPHRVSGPAQDPQPLPYLQCSDPWSFDIELEVTLATNACNEPTVIARSNYKHMYWNICQQIAHHSSNGCPLRVGDLLASGTISGPTPDSYGSLLELSWRGTKPLKLENGTSRTFLQDGDCLTLTGISRSSDSCVGFGEVSGSILPAKIDDNLIVNR